jgi:hypothetical protein
MRERAEFLEAFGKIPSKEFGSVLKGQRGWWRWSLRREYLGKEQLT